MVPSTFEDIKHQLQVVLKHYEDELALGRPAVKKVHINFMARGEPLESPLFHGRSWLFLATYLLSVLAYTPLFKNKVEVKFNISTIIPNALTLADLPNTFEANLWPAPVETRVYYSLYSMDQEFRKRWMPKAKNPYLALEMLAEWQARTKGQVVLHWAMIENENDSLDCIDRIVEAVRASGLKAKFNLVRYNPFSSNQGQESSEDIINARFKDLSEAMLVPGSRIVPKVGPDVYASCGMFLNRGQHA
jgi:adenine C2-methylase RlmN of 23S rRNA A2503 and tRNA A37